jgi:hypothetical protein
VPDEPYTHLALVVAYISVALVWPRRPADVSQRPSVTWKAGDTIPLGGRTLRVVAVHTMTPARRRF